MDRRAFLSLSLTLMPLLSGCSGGQEKFDRVGLIYMMPPEEKFPDKSQSAFLVYDFKKTMLAAEGIGVDFGKGNLHPPEELEDERFMPEKWKTRLRHEKPRLMETRLATINMQILNDAIRRESQEGFKFAIISPAYIMAGFNDRGQFKAVSYVKNKAPQTLLLAKGEKARLHWPGQDITIQVEEDGAMIGPLLTHPKTGKSYQAYMPANLQEKADLTQLTKQKRSSPAP